MAPVRIPDRLRDVEDRGVGLVVLVANVAVFVLTWRRSGASLRDATDRICAVTSFPPTVAGVADYGATRRGLARDARVGMCRFSPTVCPPHPRRREPATRGFRRVLEEDRADHRLRSYAESRRSRRRGWFNLVSRCGTRPRPVTAMSRRSRSPARSRTVRQTLHDFHRVG